MICNRTNAWYFANDNPRHFAFNAEDSNTITHIHDFAEKLLANCTLGQMISRHRALVAGEQMVFAPTQEPGDVLSA